jgi:hypothetical protein
MDHSEPRWGSRARLSRGATLRSFLVARASSLARQYVGRCKPSRTPQHPCGECFNRARQQQRSWRCCTSGALVPTLKALNFASKLRTLLDRAAVPTWLPGKRRGPGSPSCNLVVQRPKPTLGCFGQRGRVGQLPYPYRHHHSRDSAHDHAHTHERANRPGGAGWPVETDEQRQ